MATVKAFIRTTKKDMANVRFRLTDGRKVQLFYKSNIEVDPAKWDSKNQCYKARALVSDQDRIIFSKEIADIKNMLLNTYKDAEKDNINSEIFCQLVDEALNPEKYKPKSETIFDIFDTFIEKKRVSKSRKSSYLVTKRILQRYELFKCKIEKEPFVLTLDNITPDLLEDLDSFIRNEHTLCEEHPDIYKAIKECRKPEQRGENRIIGIKSTLRAFILWANETDRTTNNAFRKYKIKEAVYGNPIYITIEERDKIYNTDLSNKPALAVQRDIFIFQCLIGCRVGDLMKLTPDNVINEAVEYIPRKTIDERPVMVRVPLNDTAKGIIERYKDVDKKGRLLPFISSQKYNKAIKEVFKAAEVNRIVTVINPKTGEEEKKQIDEIASSHMARRTFAGNIYKKVKDPNLVGSLTGHKEGSKAFARYRDIDEDIRKELIKHLD